MPPFSPSTRCAILDLDDTLYPEHTYFLSGMSALGKWLDRRKNETGWQERLLHDFSTRGRAGILDRIPVPGDFAPTAWRKALLHVYRTHEPFITLFDDVAPFIAQCRQRGISLAIVTDGKSVVQHAKIKALGLGGIDYIVCTDDIDCPKPSPFSFLSVAMQFGITPQACTYIADDPSKDFIAPNELGMLSIQIKRQLPYPLIKPSTDATAQAKCQIFSLAEALPMICRSSA